MAGWVEVRGLMMKKTKGIGWWRGKSTGEEEGKGEDLV